MLALDAGVPAGWVAADEAYGQDSKFRTWCEHRKIGYVVAVPRSQSIPLPLDAGFSLGSRRADDLVARRPSRRGSAAGTNSQYGSPQLPTSNPAVTMPVDSVERTTVGGEIYGGAAFAENPNGQGLSGNVDVTAGATFTNRTIGANGDTTSTGFVPTYTLGGAAGLEYATAPRGENRLVGGLYANGQYSSTAGQPTSALELTARGGAELNVGGTATVNPYIGYQYAASSDPTNGDRSDHGPIAGVDAGINAFDNDRLNGGVHYDPVSLDGSPAVQFKLNLTPGGARQAPQPVEGTVGIADPFEGGVDFTTPTDIPTIDLENWNPVVSDAPVLNPPAGSGTTATPAPSTAPDMSGPISTSAEDLRLPSEPISPVGPTEMNFDENPLDVSLDPGVTPTGPAAAVLAEPVDETLNEFVPPIDPMIGADELEFVGETAPLDAELATAPEEALNLPLSDVPLTESLFTPQAEPVAVAPPAAPASVELPNVALDAPAVEIPAPAPVEVAVAPAPMDIAPAPMEIASSPALSDVGGADFGGDFGDVGGGDLGDFGGLGASDLGGFGGGFGGFA